MYHAMAASFLIVGDEFYLDSEDEPTKIVFSRTLRPTSSTTLEVLVVTECGCEYLFDMDDRVMVREIMD